MERRSYGKAGIQILQSADLSDLPIIGSTNCNHFFTIMFGIEEARMQDVFSLQK